MFLKGLSVFASLLSLTYAAPAAVNTSAVALSAQGGPATSIGFGSAQWIWTGENAGPGGSAPISTRAFRKTLTSPYGKCAVCATILITADNAYTLYVNGAQVGTGNDFTVAQVYTAGLQSDSNVIAVSAENVPPGGPAALIATILVEYTDGSSATFVTDSSWKTFVGNVPSGFQDPSTDDSSWSASVVQGTDGVSPWGQTRIPPALDLTQSHWIWTSEATTPGAAVAPGTRAFRKTIQSPKGKCAVCAKAVITVDNGYTLYLNGQTVGSGGNFHTAQYFSMTNLNTESNLFAVEATNADVVPNPAGVLATILIAYNDGTSQVYRTDTTWKTLPNVIPPGFELPVFDDSLWPAAVDQGADGVSPWGAVTVPSA